MAFALRLGSLELYRWLFYLDYYIWVLVANGDMHNYSWSATALQQVVYFVKSYYDQLCTDTTQSTPK
jgi:hypothetical protein